MGHRALIALVLTSASAAAEPRVTPPAPVAGDGRSVAPVVVESDPVKGTKELPVPEVAVVACSGAAALPAVAKEPPAVLAPALTRPARLDCVARIRGGEAKLVVDVTPPPAGLYASATDFAVKSTAREVVLEPFVWTGGTRTAPTALRAAASEGTIAARADKLVLAIAGNAPRLVAIALVDGERVGAAFVPVTGVTTIPVESDAGASVQMWIAGSWFGPVKTVGRIAQVPIEVPPGATHGVARSTAREGYITDAVTDLKIPPRPRIAAATSAQVPARASTVIAIAIAGANGRPAAATTPVVATAARGVVETARSLGGGLWSARYTAPTSAGADKVTIRIANDKTGTGEVALDVTAGSAARIELDVAAGPYEPGTALGGSLRVLDGSGNPVRDPAVTVRLGGVPLTVVGGDPVEFRGRVPERLPIGELTLEVATGGTTERRAIATRTVPATASAQARVDGRAAIVELAVRDRFGNLVQDGAFDVDVTGARLVQLRRGQRAFEATLAAQAGAVSARIIVRTSGTVLAEREVAFEPPASAIVVGAWSTGGWVDNLGALASPRASAGLGLRRGLGLELALLVGVEAMRFSDTTQVTIDQMTLAADRSVTGIGVSGWLRARARLSPRFGVALAGGVVPTRARVKLGVPGHSDEYSEGVVGVRAQAQVDARLGPGRLFVGGAYGRATLRSGAVIGQVDGVAIVGGYEWWFAAFGR
jgi:hypothetical protein